MSIKIDCISDLHGYYPQLEGGDLLIIAGDLTSKHTFGEFAFEFITWLSLQDYKKKIVVAGNHDTMLRGGAEELLEPFSTYLCDSGTGFEGLKIWGSPWSKRFKGMNPACMAFTVDTEEELAEKWELIPDDVDILITHSPPYGIFDAVRRYGPFSHEREELVGSKSLAIRLLDIKPKLHVFGHIHEQGGQHVQVNFPSQPCQFVNVSHVNEQYEPVNKPIRIIL